jgi:hypothetical protein
VLTGTAGTQGYASGLIGALAQAGVDVTDSERVKEALRDKTLMERARNGAARDATIAAGITAAMALKKQAPPSTSS